MSQTPGTTNNQDDDTTRELGSVEPTPGASPDVYATDTHGTDTPTVGMPAVTGVATSPGSSAGTTSTSGPSSTSSTTSASSSGTTGVAKDEAKATGEQAKEGAKHVAEVGKEEAKNVAQETTQQAKQLWDQTRSQLMDQSAQQQTRVAEGLRSLSQELSGMARGSEQQGVASDLAHQASQRVGDVASWLDQRDPGSLVSEVKQFARQRPGTFLAAAAVVGLIGGRLSRGLVADHQDQADTGTSGTSYDTGTASGTGASYGAGTSTGTSVPPVDHSTTGYSAYGSTAGSAVPSAPHPVTDEGVGTGSDSEAFRA